MRGATTSGERASQDTIPLMIVDDHPVVRQGLRTMIDAENDLQVCGEAEGMSDAIQLYFDREPQMLVVDLSLENGSGLELIKELISINSELNILVCSMHDEALFAERALHAGAKGYINKHEATAELIMALRQIGAGGVYLSQEMTQRMLTQKVRSHNKTARNSIETLSDRELEVFEQIGQGITTRQIAEKLHLSSKTVETHRENIKHKLNLSNATELTRHAVRWVLLNA